MDKRSDDHKKTRLQNLAIIDQIEAGNNAWFHRSLLKKNSEVKGFGEVLDKWCGRPIPEGATGDEFVKVDKKTLILLARLACISFTGILESFERKWDDEEAGG